MSDAIFKTYVVTGEKDGDVFGNAKTMSDLRIYMHECDKKDAHIAKLEAENKELRECIQDRLDQDDHMEGCQFNYDSGSFECHCMDRNYHNHDSWVERAGKVLKQESKE